MVQFVGRELDLAVLHEQLQQYGSVGITAIQGMGGIGKSELALQYARCHWQQGSYPGGVCWLVARGQDIASQIVSFARSKLGLKLPDELKLAEQVGYCWQRWPDGEVLVVVDDVTDYRAVKAYLPAHEGRFRVLLTTRLQLGRSIQSFEIKVLSEAASLGLLESFIGAKQIAAEEVTAKDLCGWLGYLPLGLELVGRYLERKPDLSLQKLQERLEKQRLKAQALCQCQDDMTAEHKSVAAAFELSWQELGESEQQLAYVLSLFALAPIPWVLVKRCLSEADEEDLEDWQSALLSRSLLQRVEAGVYQLHQLIREFFGAKLLDGDGVDELRQVYGQVMVVEAQQLPETPTREQIVAFSPLVPHVTEAATVLRDGLSEEALIWPFVSLGRFYAGQGAYEQAVPWREQCLVVTRERLGEEHPDVALSLNNLAFLYQSQGRYAEAEAHFQQALELYKRLRAEEHPDMALSLNGLAFVYKSQGRYGEAEPIYQQALELYKRLLGQEHPSVLKNLNNLANLYRLQGRYGEAEPMFQQVLSMTKRLLGREHPDVAKNLTNLANVYRLQGRYAEAEPMFQQALSMRKRLLGQEHPSVANTLNNLALLYYYQGRYGEAEPMFQQVLSMRKRFLGQEHPSVANTLNNLGELYYYQGRYGEAEPMFQQALSMRKRFLGQEHPYVANTLNNLGELYKSQGHFTKAEPLYQKALSIRKHLLGEDHPDVAKNLNDLGELYKSQGHFTKAEPLYQKALSMRKRLLGEDHPDVALSLNNLGEFYKSQGHFTKAESMYLKALQIFEQQLGMEHPNIITVRNNLKILRDG